MRMFLQVEIKIAQSLSGFQNYVILTVIFISGK